MSEIKVNKISPRTNCGTVTLGDSGDSFTIPAGATITNSGTAVGFGATGSASWVTSSIKTSTFTATAGEGYFVNTTGGAVTVNLPAGTAGAVVAVKDYAGTFDTNNCTIAANGSDKIGGTTDDAVLSEEGIAVTLVFIDSTQGWLVTDSGLQSEAPKPAFITATGGTITTVCTNYKVHTFTGPGTFTVCSVGNSQGSNEVSYMVVAGGGSAGNNYGGGGGGGGFREGKTPQCSYTSSPLACTSGSNNGLPVAATGYPIVVGAGGTATTPTNTGNKGSDSSFSTITSTGGGFGGGAAGSPGGAGGSGGGSSNSPSSAGAGNTPSVSPSQGNPGGTSPLSNEAGGGGGAGAAGATNGTGGDGAQTSINSSATYYSGGAGGYSNVIGATRPGGQGGAGGGPTPAGGPFAGVANTGGGSAYNPAPGGNEAGGSGIVIIRYRFQ